MTLHEIRDKFWLSGHSDSIPGGNTNHYMKKISLTKGVRHTVEHIDVFNDGLESWISQEGATVLTCIMVTKHPPSRTFMDGGFNSFEDLPTMAGDENVLYKSYTVAEVGRGTVHSEFPSSFLATMETFSFYVPHIYLSMFIYVNGEFIVLDEPAISLYMAIRDTKIDDVEYMMGLYKEYQDAQWALKETSGILLPPALNDVAGYYWPTWMYGGIRPELMVRADALADWFVDYSSASSAEKVLDLPNMTIFAQGSRTMQPFDSFFGTDDPVKGGVPDWVQYTLPNAAVFGPERPVFPALKYTDTGVVLML